MTDFFTCPDCEQPTAPERDALCPSCSKWRDKWLAGMNVEYQEQQDRKARWAHLRMSPGRRRKQGGKGQQNRYNRGR